MDSSPYPIRINAICPWFTETRLAKGVSSDWHSAGLPVNQPIDVAKVIAGLYHLEYVLAFFFKLLTSFGGIAANRSLNGAALFVSGGKAWDIERGINELQSQWLGEDNHRAMVKGQAVLGNGDRWIVGHRN